MHIIRDEVTFGLAMIPLFVDWNVRRCNVDGCTDRPNTIVTGTEAEIFGLCEEHYQEGNVPGGTTYNLVFDDFDAFRQREESNHANGNGPPTT